LFPEDFQSSWEPNVLHTELHRKENIAWYRNPDRLSQDSIGITYEADDEIKILRPDFLFFGSLGDGTIVADIVDPHGHHLADSLPNSDKPKPKRESRTRYGSPEAKETG
jgi:hypothetical protein